MTIPLTTRIERTIRAMREMNPLVHNITNFVVMEVTANALLAAGASPIMAHEHDEMYEISRLASALVLNIGTLSKPWIHAMETAAEGARRNDIPAILDPVGAGASVLRTSTSVNLLKLAAPAVLRGNASEIIAVAAAVKADEPSLHGKGVDSVNTTEEAQDAAHFLARMCNCIVSVSGEKDFITDSETSLHVHGGSPLMPKVTGMGCSATALTAAYVAAADDTIIGAAAAMAVMAEAGENAGRKASGPGSFLPIFLDELYCLTPARAAERVEVL